MSSTDRPWHFHRPTYAEIDTRRLKSNFAALKSLFPEGTFLCPMVKANAYGHGDIEVTRALRSAGAEQVGVGLIEEGMGLRLSGDTGKILLFGLFEERSADAVLEFELTPVLSSWEQIGSLERAAQKAIQKRNQRAHPVESVAQPNRIPVHIKFNTGMNRLGFDVYDASTLRTRLESSEYLQLEGICTHLLRGDDAGAEGGESESQFTLFAEAAQAFEGMKIHVHALNSSGAANLWKRVSEKKRLTPGVSWPLGARPGLSTYGIQPSNDENVLLNLQPVLSLKSQVVMLHRLDAGERVSYNATWRALRTSLIGVVPAGYADGVFRSLTNKGRVLVRGEYAPMIGTVCMDYFMIDLTDVEAMVSQRGDVQIARGEEVVLIGDQSGANGMKSISASDIASVVGTIPYEILTHIGERVPRVYIRSEA